MLVVQLEETINAFHYNFFFDMHTAKSFDLIKLKCRMAVKNSGGQYYGTGNSSPYNPF